MKRKYRLKKTADNDFTRSFGIEAFFLTRDGKESCLVTKIRKHKGESVQRLMYSFNVSQEINELSKLVHVKPKCGIDQCVRLGHLVAEFSPTKKEIEKIIHMKEMGHTDEYIATETGVPIKMLSQYFVSLPSSE